MRVALSNTAALKLGKQLRRLLAADGIPTSLGRCHQAIARLHGHTSLHELQAVAAAGAVPIAAPPLSLLDPAPLADSLGLPLSAARDLLRRLADTAPTPASDPSDRLLWLVEDVGLQRDFITLVDGPVAGHRASRHGLEFLVADLPTGAAWDVQIRGAADGTWRLLGARLAGEASWRPPHGLPQRVIEAVFGPEVAGRYWDWRDRQAGAGEVDAFYGAQSVRLGGLGPAVFGVTRELSGVAPVEPVRACRALLGDEEDRTPGLPLPATERAVLAFLERLAHARGGDAAATAFRRAEAVRRALLERGEPPRYFWGAPNIPSHRQGRASDPRGEIQVRPDVMVDPVGGDVQVTVMLRKTLPDRAGLLPDLPSQAVYDDAFLPALDALPPEIYLEPCHVFHQGFATPQPVETPEERRAKLEAAFSREPRIWIGRNGRKFVRPDPGSEQEWRLTTEVDLETDFVVAVPWCGDAAQVAERVLATVSEHSLRTLFEAADAAERQAYQLALENAVAVRPGPR